MQASEVRRVAVVGAGLMGHGIAQDFAVHGYQVSLVTFRIIRRSSSGLRGWLERR